MAKYLNIFIFIAICLILVKAALNEINPTDGVEANGVDKEITRNARWLWKKHHKNHHHGKKHHSHHGGHHAHHQPPSQYHHPHH